MRRLSSFNDVSGIEVIIKNLLPLHNSLKNCLSLDTDPSLPRIDGTNASILSPAGFAPNAFKQFIS